MEHSWSKDFFEDKFIRENFQNCTYKNFLLSDISMLRRMVSNNPSISGLNVTIPYKIAVIPYLDSLENDAARIGAVNCIKVSRTWQGLLLKGYNTDSPAFRSTLGPFLQGGLEKALILGTGGAAKAVSFALASLGIGHRFVSRTAKPECLTYADVTPALIGQVQLIVNATPAGMKGLEEEFPHLPYEAFGEGLLLYDLVYNPEETLFLRKGRQSGARIKSGLEMLKLQAGLSWDLWMKG